MRGHMIGNKYEYAVTCLLMVLVNMGVWYGLWDYSQSEKNAIKEFKSAYRDCIEREGTALLSATEKYKFFCKQNNQLVEYPPRLIWTNL